MTSRGWNSQASVDSYLIHWREDNGASIGEGLSRTSNPNAKLYEIVVTFSGMRPMREQLRATSSAEAAKFAANRYPTHTNITVVTKNNAKRSA
jgi:hypothetical protein